MIDQPKAFWFKQAETTLAQTCDGSLEFSTCGFARMVLHGNSLSLFGADSLTVSKLSVECLTCVKNDGLKFREFFATIPEPIAH
ncbi:MAG: hypothetical protein ABJZ55_10200 [Fuerstiella sp.]